jgi:hypothetical protein
VNLSHSDAEYSCIGYSHTECQDSTVQITIHDIYFVASSVGQQ